MTTALTPTGPMLPALYDLEACATSFTALERAMGGRPQIIEALLSLPPSPDTAIMIGAIADPQNDQVALARICAANGIHAGALIEAYRKGRMALAHVESTNVMAEHTVETVRDVMVRSAPHDVRCASCDGTGSVTSRAKPDAPPTPCEECKGSGTRTVLPDLDRQKFALELAGLGPRKVPTTLVNVDNRKVNVRDVSQANYEKMLFAMDAASRGAKVVIEPSVDVTPPPALDNADPTP